MQIYLEIGTKKTFAGAVDWIGWCRSGRDEVSARQALFETGPRYARAMQAAGIDFRLPADESAFQVVERLTGTATTDFGAPDAAPSGDSQPLDAAGQKRLHALLQACWQALDEAAKAAAGKELRKGPRGGGRDLEGVIRHVLDAEAGYLTRLAIKNPKNDLLDLNAQMEQTRQSILAALDASVRGQIPERGPRGGVIWPARYFARRVAWHVLDHAWEIEDRIVE
jgi:hypothetical protein